MHPPGFEGLSLEVLNKGEDVEEEDPSSKYRTWGGWDLLSDKTKLWTDSVEIAPRPVEQESSTWRYSTTGAGQTRNPSFFSAGSSGAFTESLRTQEAHHQPMAPKETTRPDAKSSMFIVKTFEVEASRHLLLYSIPSTLEAEDLCTIMSAYGEVESADFDRKQDLGVALLSYFDIRDAKAAMDKMQSPGMPVEAQFCIHPISGMFEGEKCDEHKILVHSKDQNGRGLSLTEVMSEFGRFGEVLGVTDDPHGGKIVDFPDVRTQRIAVQQSGYSRLTKAEVLPISTQQARLGQSFWRFLRKHRSSVESGSIHSSDGQSSYDSAPAPARGYQPSGLRRNDNQNRAPRGGTLMSRRQSFSDYSNNGGIVQPVSPSQGPTGRVASRGSHPHHQKLGRVDSPKKSQSADFVINIQSVLSAVDKRTSLMVRNIPNKYDQNMVLEEIDQHFSHQYDFFYLPIDFKNRCNVGYAFINFIDAQDIADFYEKFNRRKWNRFNSEKVCQISYARIQGKAKLVSRFQNSSLMAKDQGCRPLVFHSSGPLRGTRAEFPGGH